MSKTVEKIVINTEGIDVISVQNGVNNVTQLSLEPQENEVQEIFKKYNLETVVLYPFDTSIVQALGEYEEQLIDYLSVCRKASFPTKKVELPDTIPDIEYDLRNLKNSFQDIQDDSLRRSKQIEMYKRAKEVQSVLRGKTTLKMGLFDRGYFSVQELLLNRSNKTPRLMLNPGITEERANLRKELYNPEYARKTDEVSKEYVEQLRENTQIKENEEKENSSDKEIAI